jgi:hypothetical protein
METEIKRTDFPDTPEGQHLYEMKIYTQELETKNNDAMLLEQLDIILNSLDLKKDKK